MTKPKKPDRDALLESMEQIEAALIQAAEDDKILDVEFELERGSRILDRLRVDVDEVEEEPRVTQFSKTLFMKTKWMESKTRENDERNSLASQSMLHSHSSTSRPPLPKLALPKFNGEPLEYRPFIEKFSADVHSRDDLEPVQKFSYLKGCLCKNVLDLIEGLPLTGANYDEALQLLEKRFGNPSKLIALYASKLIEVKSASYSEHAVRTLIDSFRINYRQLKGLLDEVYGKDENKPNPDVPLQDMLLCPLLTSKLPAEIKLEWDRRVDAKYKFDLETLFNFIEDELSFLASRVPKNAVDVPFKPRGPALSATFNSAAHESSLCSCCGLSYHSPFKCETFISLSPEERRNLTQRKTLCMNCLRGGHRARDCLSKRNCATCNKRHHTLLHGANFRFQNPSRNPSANLQAEPSDTSPHEPTDQNTSQTVSANQAAQKTLMMTAMVRVVGIKEPVRALLDTASDTSYVTEEVMKRGKLRPSNHKLHCVQGFAGLNTTPVSRPIVEVVLSAVNESAKIQVQAMVYPFISSPPPRASRNIQLNFARLADPFSDANPKVDILLGMDVLPQIFTTEAPFRMGSLLYTPTIFGLVVAGKMGQAQSGALCSVARTLRISSDVESTWLMERAGLTESEIPNDPMSTPRKVGDRYEMELPFLDDERPTFSFRDANTRLEGYKRYSKEKKDEYTQILEDYHNQGILEPAESAGGNFLPHHGVQARGKALRIVYDASAKSSRGKSSLNDLLAPGPNLLQSLIQILLRFGNAPVPLVADIQKAFLQVSVKPEDRDFLKIAWLDKSNQIRYSRFTRVCFGLNCGPALLLTVLNFHFAQMEGSYLECSNRLKRDIYMDDVVTSFNSIQEATAFKESSQAVLSEAGMKLCKFDSSVQELKDPDRPPENQVRKILGLSWTPSRDTCEVQVLVPDNLPRTKRNVASQVAAVFDPLGFATPWTLPLRLFLQRLWTPDSDWDSCLPPEKLLEWEDLKTRLNKTTIEWPRFSFALEKAPFLVFCDASKDAYAACIYATGQDTSRLVCAKAKLAPKAAQGHAQTIPRLELLAALLAVRLYVFARQAYQHEGTVTFHSDSEIVLHWIRGNPTDIFVRNRIREIKSHTAENDWFHIPGDQNPADFPSRGASNHPSREEVRSWVVGADILQSLQSRPTLSNTMTGVEMEPLSTAWMEKFSSLRRLTRVLAWMRRFKCSSETRSRGDLKPEEIDQSSKLLFRIIQMSQPEYKKVVDGKNVTPGSPLWDARPYVDDGLIYCRLRNGDEPKMWLPDSHLMKLVIREIHARMGHLGTPTCSGELNRLYWVSKGRSQVRKELKACFICKRFNAPAFSSPEGSLPNFRASPARPFSKTGVDMAGPIMEKNGGKRYIMLFTCASVRAIHLELMESLSQEATSHAVRRFAAVYGLPDFFISDNGTNFVGLANQLQGIINWKTIPQGSPWWTGFIERMVGTVKRALRKTIGRTSLNDEELRTTLAELQSGVNRRPLLTTPEGETLSPAHFLYSAEPPPLASPYLATRVPKASISLAERLQMRQETSSHLWKRWRLEYFQTLQNWRRKNCPQTPISVGDVVLVAPPDGVKVSRTHWRMGRVTSLITGTDGVVRAVYLRIGELETRRPIKKLYPLECTSKTDLHASDTDVQIPEEEPRDVDGVAATDTRLRREVERPEEESQDPHNVAAADARTRRQVERPAHFRDFVLEEDDRGVM